MSARAVATPRWMAAEARAARAAASMRPPRLTFVLLVLGVRSGFVSLSEESAEGAGAESAGLRSGELERRGMARAYVLEAELGQGSRG